MRLRRLRPIACGATALEPIVDRRMLLPPAIATLAPSIFVRVLPVIRTVFLPLGGIAQAWQARISPRASLNGARPIGRASMATPVASTTLRATCARSPLAWLWALRARPTETAVPMPRTVAPPLRGLASTVRRLAQTLRPNAREASRAVRPANVTMATVPIRTAVGAGRTEPRARRLRNAVTDAPVPMESATCPLSQGQPIL